MFDWYVFADYSGSLHLAEQRRRMALSIKKDNETAVRTSLGWTRVELADEAARLLEAASESGKRMIFGFDHNYSFPAGFFEALTGKKWTEWRELIKLLAKGGHGMPALDPEAPRIWAKEANERLMGVFRLSDKGPFWGPHFEPLKKPKFPFGGGLRERRFIEERCPRMKSIYQLGGAGAVGLQSLLGMIHLHGLLEFCQEHGIPLHVWPFDGLEIPDGFHVLVEMYPTLFNKGVRTDQNDAESCVIWLSGEDCAGRLKTWFSPMLSEIEKDHVRLEGWCLGI